VNVLAGQLIAQHTRTQEGVLQMQLVDSPHQRQVGLTEGSGQVVRRASADLEQFGLVNNWQLVVSVDHGFSLSNPALVSARACQKFCV
jgi:hypothetical protein